MNNKGESTTRLEMMLKNKVAVIYGAGGAIGSAVARAFAREGAKLRSRKPSNLAPRHRE
jgi:NAD(P)-dependent dehydrogenase (short-subunit alcohol dehydrogenase family)